MPTEITSGSARIASDDSGSGPAVVLLHAGVADRRCWATTTVALTDRNRVVAYDRRGYGATTYEPEPHDHVTDLIAVLDALGIDDAVLVGNSMGGRVALDAVLDAPERVRGLVVIGSAVSGAPSVDLADDLQGLIDRVEEAEEAGDLDAVNALECRLWLDGPSRPEGAVAGPARSLFLEMNGAALRAVEPGDELPRDPAWERLGHVDVPVLSLVGVHDLPHMVERSGEIARRVPGGSYLELAGSAHLPMLDDPGPFDAAVRRFVDEVGGADTLRT